MGAGNLRLTQREKDDHAHRLTGDSPGLSHAIATSITVTAVITGTVPVDLSSAYNVTGIYNDGSTFNPDASLDGDGYSFSEQLLGSEQVGEGVVFKLGPANAPDAVTGKTLALPAAKVQQPQDSRHRR